MNNVRIAIIDSGISETSDGYKNITNFYSLKNYNNKFLIEECEPSDKIGHGTAVSHIIWTMNNNVEIICFKICDHELDINEEGLIFILKYIEKNITVDIINISLGCTYLYNYEGLKNICKKITKKGTIIVSAFDNEGAISYPAAFEEVIGVDIKHDYCDKNEVYAFKDGIVDILVPDVYYRTKWINQNTIIKGTSFANAMISGLISQKINIKNSPYSKQAVLKLIATKYNKNLFLNALNTKQSIQINKAILFPTNKESHAILRYNDLLQFELTGVYDDRLSGNVGSNLFGQSIKSVDLIDWEDDFDTIILSCIKDLSFLTKKNYIKFFLEKAKQYGKQIYTFEKFPNQNNFDQVFYPQITPEMVPLGNHLKIHKTTLPIVSILGTSSRQGKYTLQLELIKRLRKVGYNPGHISTEPSGYLFGSDFVFHCGYHSDYDLEPWKGIAILNEMVWQAFLNKRDILITGCQSGVLHFNNSNIQYFNIDQYTFLLGIMPDICVLCINPHDEIGYLHRTIDFINSIDNGKVIAIVVFPIRAVETLSGIAYKTEIVADIDLKKFKHYIHTELNLPVFTLGNQIDMEDLCELIITNFSND